MGLFRLHRARATVPRSSPATDADGEDQAGRILSGLDDLRDTPVHEVMTPRVDVVGLPIPVTASHLAAAVRQSGHSTFPVYDDDLDNLIGVLYARDLFRTDWHPARAGGRHQQQGTATLAGALGDPPLLEDGPSSAATGGPTTGPARGPAGGSGAPAGGPATRPAGGGTGLQTDVADDALSPLDISRSIRKPYVVPESRLVLDVLAAMRRDRRAFAVVVDEYGGVAGIVTIKDLLAALVGDLRDEFDRGGQPDVIRVDRSRWLVDGGVSVDDLREQLGVPIPEGEYVTLGGYLLDVTGHIPEEGEEVPSSGWEYRVVEMDRRRVAKVVVRALDGSADRR